MSPSSEDLLIGRAAQKRVHAYEDLSKKRLMLYLIPMCWFASSVIHYELRSNWSTRFQLIFWAAALILIIIFDLKRRKTYLRDTTTLENLRNQYGSDVSFSEEKVPIPTDPNP